MIDFISIKNFTHQQWLDFRMQGLGGSEIGGVFGQSKWDDAMKVHLNKTSEPMTSFSGNRFTKTGQWLEDHIKVVIIEIIAVTVFEVGNVTIIDWFVYAYLKWTEAEAIVTQLWIINLIFSAVYFFFFGTSYLFRKIRNCI